MNVTIHVLHFYGLLYSETDAHGACGIGFEQRMKEINKSKKERVHQELVSLIQMN